MRQPLAWGPRFAALAMTVTVLVGTVGRAEPDPTSKIVDAELCDAKLSTVYSPESLNRIVAILEAGQRLTRTQSASPKEPTEDPVVVQRETTGVLSRYEAPSWYLNEIMRRFHARIMYGGRSQGPSITVRDALALRAHWRIPFDPKSTHNDIFRSRAGIVHRPFMRGRITADYIETGKAQYAKLRYERGY